MGQLQYVTLAASALATIHIGSARSLALHGPLGKPTHRTQSEEESKGHVDETDVLPPALDSSAAMAAPILTSVALLGWFFLFGRLSALITAYVCVCAWFAVGFVIFPFVKQSQMIIKRCASPSRPLVLQPQPDGNRYGFPDLASCTISGVMALGVLLQWLESSSLALNNVLGCCLCVTLLSFLRFENLRVATLLMVGLLAYDVFWVFISPWLWNRNVMTEVAMKQAPNPLHYVGNSLTKLNIPVPVTASIALPLKLMVPDAWQRAQITSLAILGLGDIVLPGLLVVHSLRFDALLSKNSNNPTLTGSAWPTYFMITCTGYVVGLVISFYCSFVYEVAQPALLYLVPCTLAPLCLVARSRDHFKVLWGTHWHETV